MSASRQYLELYLDKYNPQSMKMLEALLEKNPENAELNYFVGMRRYNNSQGARDSETLRLLKKAAELKHPSACYMLGVCYETGKFDTVNLGMASRCYMRAIQYGEAYRYPEELSPRDEAFKRLPGLLTKCDREEMSVVLNNLGCAYVVVKNYDDGFKYLEQASDLGLASAKGNLAVTYFLRGGVELVEVSKILRLCKEMNSQPGYVKYLRDNLEALLEEYPELRTQIESQVENLSNILLDRQPLHRVFKNSISLRRQKLKNNKEVSAELVVNLEYLTEVFLKLLNIELGVLSNALEEQIIDNEQLEIFKTNLLMEFIQRLLEHGEKFVHDAAFDLDRIKEMKLLHGVDIETTHDYLRFIRETNRFAVELKSELNQIKHKILSPDSPWQITNGFFGVVEAFGITSKWVNGMPSGMKEMSAELDNLDSLSDIEIIKRFHSVMTNLKSRLDKKEEDRHPAVQRFYERTYARMKGHTFNQEIPMKKDAVSEAKSQTTSLMMTTTQQQIPAQTFTSPEPSAPSEEVPGIFGMLLTQVPVDARYSFMGTQGLSTAQFGFWMNQCPTVPMSVDRRPASSVESVSETGRVLSSARS